MYDWTHKNHRMYSFCCLNENEYPSRYCMIWMYKKPCDSAPYFPGRLISDVCCL